MTFSNPIVGGVTLIRQAIQSPDYVAGTSGWAIKKDGSADFNDVAMRGQLLVSSANGAYLLIDSDAVMSYMRINPPDIPGHTINYGIIDTDKGATPGSEFVAMYFGGPSIDAVGSPYVNLVSSVVGRRLDLFGGDEIDILATLTKVSGILRNSSDSMNYLRGQRSSGNISVATGATNVNTALVFPTAFPVGVTPTVICNLSAGLGASVGWHARGISPSNTGFTLNLNGPATPAGGPFSFGYQYIALVD